MIFDDLLELLRSILEEDAIIARVYALFHIKKGYSVELLHNIVSCGVMSNVFDLEALDGALLDIDDIIWSADNTWQELLAQDTDSLAKQVFSSIPSLPEPFTIFLSNHGS